MKYSLYIVECADGTYYTGIATDVQRRVLEHNGISGKATASTQTARGKGARYTSARRPVRLVFEARFASRSEALQQEARIKRLTRPQKLLLISEARTRSERSP